MDYWITYLAVLTIALEMALMMVGYLANPRALVNRVFALFMLALVVSTAGTILLVTAPVFSVAEVGIWLHAAAIFTATPLLALLLLHLFAPSFRYLRQSTWFLVIFSVATLLLLAGDVIAKTDLVFQFDPTNYVPGYVSLADYLTGLFGPLLYFFTVQSTHVLFPLLILLVLLKGIVPARQRRAAGRLLLLLFVLGIVNGIVLWKMPVLLSLVGSLSVAFIATWGIIRERVLSPMQLGERQALDTAMFGILLFDEQGKLLEWNRTACRLMLLEGEAIEHELSSLLTRLAETAVNREGVLAFIQETTLPFTTNRHLGLILPNPTLPGAQIWLLLQFSVIKADKRPVGVLCTVEDQTAVRESQHQLQAANQSLEQFAYRATLLNDIVQTGISDLNIDTILQRFADRLGDLFLAHGCYLTLWDANQKKVLPGAAYGPMRQIYPDIPLLPDKPTVTEAVLETGKYLVVNDLSNSPFAHFHQVSTFVGISMLAVPLIAGSQKLGAMLIIFNENHLFSPSEIDLGEQAANQIALALAKMRLLETEREQRKLAVALQEIGTLLTATMDSEAVLDMTLAQIQRVVPYDTANISLLERGEIHLSRSQGYESFTSAMPDQVEGRPFSLEVVATYRQIAETRQPLCLPDTRHFEGWVVTPATRHIRSWIGVPLLLGDEIVGFLCVDKIQPGFYDESHKQHLAALAYQVTLALQHAQLFAESQRQAQRLAILNDLTTQMAGLVTVQELTDLAVERLYEDFDYDNVAVFMIDPDNTEDLVLSSVVGVYTFMAKDIHRHLRVGEGMIGQAALCGHYVLANDTADHPNFLQPPGFNTRAELAVPIKVDQTVLGVLNIDSYQTYVFDQADVSLLLIVAEQLAVAIHKARLFELTRKRAQELEILSVVSAQLRAAHAVTDMLPIVLENIAQAVHAAVGVVYLKDESGEQVVSRAVYPEGRYLLGLKHKLGQGITGYVAQTGEIYVSANLQEDGRLYLQDGELFYLNELTSAIALPLQTEDFIIGVVHIGFAQVHFVSNAERQLLSSLTDIAANALYRAQVMESLEVRVEERTQALREANNRLQELDRLKSKFISDVTHELRTPVANMNLYLDLLRMGRPEKHQHYMSVIENQTARLTEIVQTTMQVPELGTMTAPKELGEVVLVDVVQTAVSLYVARASQKGLEIILHTAADLPPVNGDAAQLGQVVQAVLSNAINYTTDGQITVTLSGRAISGMVSLQVNDTGMGIDEEDMPYIFDRFYRGQRVGQLTIPGVGMGLSVAKEIVEGHNGRIHIEGTPGVGTTCTVFLPAVVKE